MAKVRVSDLEAEPGERRRGWLTVPGTDPAWTVPAVAVRGRLPGPTLAVTSGMHAAEYVPIEAVTQLTRWVDPASLRGTLLAVLLVNTPGFYERSIYVNPRDGRNLNRSFPGDPEGSPAERVAAFLLAELIDGADAYVDAHCGDLIEALAPFTLWTRAGDPQVAERSAAMSRAYGFERALGVDPDSVPGAAYASAALRGVPAIIAEVGQQGICDGPSVARHLRGLQNVMAHLGMVDPLGPPPPDPVAMDRMDWMRTDISATYHPVVAVGDRVREGQPVGELRDIFGDTVRELRAPAAGDVVFLVTSLAVKAGDPLLGIGVPQG
ncbi:MAG TPA: succinylglutamate desuccinylase/aspartoacylase family protein [Candidatus Micrarchaeia archaeon]|nr:succinylglutamate desuccinylase/aspartoacylase family protein [Candidatus Micrarchaeia archaeon]